MPDRLTLQDLRSQYPQPPFPQQPQPAPGVASKMDPVPDHGETSYKGLGKLMGRKALVTGDIMDEGWCRKMVEQAVSKMGGLDILVINVGRQQYRENIAELSSGDFDKTMKTNLYAMHWIAQAAVPHWPASASVITTASVQAYDPSAILLDYATTKAGIVAYTQALSKQLMEKGIRANVVAPGPFCSRQAANRKRRWRSSDRKLRSGVPDSRWRMRRSMFCLPVRKAATGGAGVA